MSEMDLEHIWQTVGEKVEAELELELELEEKCFHVEDFEYDFEGIKTVTLSLQNKDRGKVVISGSVTVTVKMPCDRCLKPVKKEVTIDFEREVVAPELLENDPDQADDQKFVKGSFLEIEELLQEEVLLNRPNKMLCREDCKGLCKVCGRDLNEGDCGCDTFVQDPRMAAIADLFNHSK